jgi:hypothetical protein
MSCCSHPMFGLVEELGHAESVDFDLVQCATCHAYCLRQWSEHAPDRTFYDRLTRDEAQRFRQLQGRERKALLRAWFNEQ